MNQNRLAKWIYLSPAFIAALIDISITIIHQKKEYWQGNLDIANEANPIGAALMARHVSGIFVISGIWLIAIALLGYYLPRKISRYFLLFTLIAHSYAASSWLSGFWYPMALILFNTVMYIKANDITNRRLQSG